MRLSERRKQIRDMDDEALAVELRRLRESLFGFRRDLAMNRLSNPHAVGAARKDIARIHTLMRDRQQQAG
ncbi:MAG TPA: 50S ribosomal protein L29 [Armatimonadota bacterium]|jgi:large subunit ribosomal protein L29